MSCLFGNISFVWLIIENDEEEEDFCIEEIRCCDCFLDKIICFIEKNNGKIRNLIKSFFYEKLKIADIFIYYSPITIFCCKLFLDIFCKNEEVNKEEMDKYCLAEEIDYQCLYYLSRETIFNCICDNCQKTLLKLASKKLNSIKLK